MTGLAIGTAITADYLERAHPYLASLARHADPDDRPFCVTYGFTADRVLRERYPRIDFRPLARDAVRHPAGSGCIQWGAWLPALPDLDPQTLVCFTDADGVFGRGLFPEERERFDTWGEDVFGAGWVARPWTTLLAAGDLIFPEVPWTAITRRFPGVHRMALAGGCLIGRAAAWAGLCDAYDYHFPAVDPLFAGWSKCQWLLAWLLHERFRVELLGYDFTVDGHFPPSPEVYRDPAGTVRFRGEPVAFAHAIDDWGITLPETPGPLGSSDGGEYDRFVLSAWKRPYVIADAGGLGDLLIHDRELRIAERIRRAATAGHPVTLLVASSNPRGGEWYREPLLDLLVCRRVCLVEQAYSPDYRVGDALAAYFAAHPDAQVLPLLPDQDPASPMGAVEPAMAPEAPWPGARYRLIVQTTSGLQGTLPAGLLAALDQPGAAWIAGAADEGPAPRYAADLRGRLTPRGTAACIAAAGGFVGLHSFGMHAAWWAGVPTVAVMTPALAARIDESHRGTPYHPAFDRLPPAPRYTLTTDMTDDAMRHALAAWGFLPALPRANDRAFAA